MKVKCYKCFWLLMVLGFLMFGCNTAVKSVDYYEACLNDVNCVEDMRQAQNMTSMAVSSAVQNNSQYSSVAQIVGGVAGSVVAYFVGVVRGKKIQKG